MRGWSAYDIAQPDISLGWAGPGPGPSWIPDPAHPAWSYRAKRFLEGFLEALEPGNDLLMLYRADLHINQPEFADLAYRVLLDLLKGECRPAPYPGLEELQKPC